MVASIWCKIGLALSTRLYFQTKWRLSYNYSYYPWKKEITNSLASQMHVAFAEKLYRATRFSILL